MSTKGLISVQPTPRSEPLYRAYSSLRKRFSKRSGYRSTSVYSVTTASLDAALRLSFRRALLVRKAGGNEAPQASAPRGRTPREPGAGLRPGPSRVRPADARRGTSMAADEAVQ